MKGLKVTEAARSISLISSKSFSDNMTYGSIEQSRSLFKCCVSVESPPNFSYKDVLVICPYFTLSKFLVIQNENF